MISEVVCGYLVVNSIYYAYVRTYIRTYIHTYIHTVHTYCTYIYTYICTYVRTYRSLGKFCHQKHFVSGQWCATMKIKHTEYFTIV